MVFFRDFRLSRSSAREETRTNFGNSARTGDLAMGAYLRHPWNYDFGRDAELLGMFFHYFCSERNIAVQADIP